MKRLVLGNYKPVIEVGDLLEIQTKSYQEFLQKDIPPEKRKRQGIQAAFLDIFGDYTENQGIANSDNTVMLQFISYNISDSKLTPDECRLKGATYSGTLSAKFRIAKILKDGRIKEVSEQDVNLCELPLMLENGSFIINGSERCIVSQLHRAPGIIFEESEEQGMSYEGRRLFYAAIIPMKGTWVEFEYDLNDILYVKLERKRKILSTIFLKAFGLNTNEEIVSTFYEPDRVKVDEDIIGRYAYQAIKIENEVIVDAGDKITDDIYSKIKGHIDVILLIKYDPKTVDPAIIYTLERDPMRGPDAKENALKYIYKIMRQQSIYGVEQAEGYFTTIFHRQIFYNLSEVGRYKLNKKLRLVYNENSDFKMLDEKKRTLTKEDIIAAIKYLMFLRTSHPKAEIDEIDHLGNKRVKCVGELVEEQLRYGLYGIVKALREKLNVKEDSLLTPRKVIKTIPLVLAIKKFFATSQLSQFMDQVNPLAELTHKRRLSALGPGGLGRKRATFEARDVHYTHHNRICPVETPEGQNIGLITSLAIYGKINDYGLIETPYRVVKDGKVTNEIEYLTADKEDEYIIAPADTELDEGNRIKQRFVLARHKDEVKFYPVEQIQYMDISPFQMFSITTSLIPFIEHDDANRALMGSNMQRQAVPLLLPQVPLVATGFERYVVENIKNVIKAERSGEVIKVDANEIAIYTSSGEIDIYNLKKYFRSNQDTCINFLPVVSADQKVKSGDIIAEGPATKDGQLSLGANLLCAFMSWEGYNFEDAIVVSERLIHDDIFTSIHILDFETEIHDTLLGPEETTRDDLPLEKDEVVWLDKNGLIQIGTEVKPYDILVGKIAPREDEPETPEERLMLVLLGEKTKKVKDVSLRVPPGVRGKVIKTDILTRPESLLKAKLQKELQEITKKYDTYLEELKKEKKEVMDSIDDDFKKKKWEAYYETKIKQLKMECSKEKQMLKMKSSPLPLTVNKRIKVYVGQVRKLQVGDKLSGRHGNKGVIAKILPVEDMPYLPDGTPIDIIFSPLCVPSRMNLGQLYEMLLGYVAKILNVQIVVPQFFKNEEEIYEMIKEVKEKLKKEGVPEEYLPTDDGRITLYDGRTGQPFEEKVAVGYIYFTKLIHMVEDKIHARSTGHYTLVTQQPVGGRARFGGQRFGEMEVWAIEGYGGGYTLQEFLTLKSDDIKGRIKLYNDIVHSRIPVEPGVSESFKVLFHELRGLGLNLELIKAKDKDKK